MSEKSFTAFYNFLLLVKLEREEDNRKKIEKKKGYIVPRFLVYIKSIKNIISYIM